MSDENKKMTVADEKYLFSSTKDEILPVFRMGEHVRLNTDLRNDGTYAFAKVGEVLVKKGAEGYIRHIGDFLQTIRIYEVDFLTEGLILGCREFELDSLEHESDHDEVAEELAYMKEHRENKKKSQE